MQKLSYKQLARNLNKAIDADVGEDGLRILIYGWKRERKFGPTYCKALLNRDWLYITEVLDLSVYAGYDLTGQ